MTEQLSATERDAVVKLQKDLGTAKAAEKLGITRTSLLAVLMGDQVRSGTIALIQKHLAAASEKSP